MSTNMPPLIGEPTKKQTGVLNWTMIGLFLSAQILPIAVQLKELFKKNPPAATEQK